MLTNNNNDRANRPRENGLTEADWQKIRERYVEQARLRQAESDLNLLKAVQLGHAFKRLKGD